MVVTCVAAIAPVAASEVASAPPTIGGARPTRRGGLVALPGLVVVLVHDGPLVVVVRWSELVRSRLDWPCAGASATRGGELAALRSLLVLELLVLRGARAGRGRVRGAGAVDGRPDGDRAPEGSGGA